MNKFFYAFMCGWFGACALHSLIVGNFICVILNLLAILIQYNWYLSTEE